MFLGIALKFAVPVASMRSITIEGGGIGGAGGLRWVMVVVRLGN